MGGCHATPRYALKNELKKAAWNLRHPFSQKNLPCYYWKTKANLWPFFSLFAENEGFFPMSVLGAWKWHLFHRTRRRNHFLCGIGTNFSRRILHFQKPCILRNFSGITDDDLVNYKKRKAWKWHYNLNAEKKPLAFKAALVWTLHKLKLKWSLGGASKLLCLFPAHKKNLHKTKKCPCFSRAGLPLCPGLHWFIAAWLQWIERSGSTPARAKAHFSIHTVWSTDMKHSDCWLALSVFQIFEPTCREKAEGSTVVR